MCELRGEGRPAGEVIGERERPCERRGMQACMHVMLGPAAINSGGFHCAFLSSCMLLRLTRASLLHLCARGMKGLDRSIDRSMR
jgi:hypothetical protein